MKHITFYLDFVSPYAYLAFEQLPQTLMGQSYSVRYQPIVLGAVFKHHGHMAPAQLPSKRAWIYRHVRWLAHQQGIALQMPAQHPFAPLPLLRLALACGEAGAVNRYGCETVFKHVWQGGLDAVDPWRLQALTEQLSPAHSPQAESVKAQLRANTEQAIARGVFGVPAFEVDGKLFWGLDALPMLRAYLAGDDGFAAAWDVADEVQDVGVSD